ncbi:MAG: hypothetical protein ACD_5C00342G0005 [uncultured bacterium]|nr:MAG: hypothetical protein ACD_5C00342G0005 [uncultured bacterium]
MKDVIVKKSKINGKGLFAMRNFKKGELVLKWNPKILTKSDLKTVYKDEEKYVWHAGRNLYVFMQPPERFVNHSCDPNLTVRKNCEYAKRDINKSEELTSNYRRTPSDSAAKYFDCSCGSKNCKGRVN